MSQKGDRDNMEISLILHRKTYDTPLQSRLAKTILIRDTNIYFGEVVQNHTRMSASLNTIRY